MTITHAKYCTDIATRIRGIASDIDGTGTADSLVALADELEQQVDCTIIYQAPTKERQAALEAAFDLVKPKDDWKAPIGATVTIDQLKGLKAGSIDDAIRLVEDAIGHFTATEGNILKAGSAAGRALYRVEAEGYRMGPCGDH